MAGAAESAGSVATAAAAGGRKFGSRRITCDGSRRRPGVGTRGLRPVVVHPKNLRQPAEVARGQRVTDVCDRVDHAVRDDQRPQPSCAPPHVREHQAHHDIAQARAEALIEVVRPAQQAGCQQRGDRVDPQLPQPGEQERDDDDFLGPAVGERGDQQDSVSATRCRRAQRARRTRSAPAPGPRRKARARAGRSTPRVRGHPAGPAASRSRPSPIWRGPKPLRHNRYTAEETPRDQLEHDGEIQAEVDQVER